jgi:four helix bundle protein
LAHRHRKPLAHVVSFAPGVSSRCPLRPCRAGAGIFPIETTTTLTPGVAHQRLDADHVALELLARVEDLTSRFPRGHRDLRDQIRRAAAATVRHIAEGAVRAHPADKAARFLVAKGEVGECDACLEMTAILGLGCPHALANLRLSADRVAAMLTGWVRRERRRG